MQIGVQAASSRLGVSPRRVRAMIERGDLAACSVSGRWVLEEADLLAVGVRRAVRPMTPRIAGALLDLISGVEVRGLTPSEMWRLRRHRDALCTDPAPAVLLRAWMRARPRPRVLSAAPADLPDLAADPRVVASGISDDRSGMMAVGELEGWVARADLHAVCDEYLLVEGGTRNVVLHVADGAVGAPVPLGWSIADLAEHRGPREEAEVARLLQQVSAPR